MRFTSCPTNIYILLLNNTLTEKCEGTSNTLRIDDKTMPIPSDDIHSGTKYLQLNAMLPLWVLLLLSVIET